MKTNITHTLIVAIILVIAWSLFTILQDVISHDTGSNSSYDMVGRSRQYLPVAPVNNTRRSELPVYKGSNRSPISGQSASRQSPTSNQSSLLEMPSGVQSVNSTGGMLGIERAVVASRRQQENTNIDYTRHNMLSPNIAAPFSKEVRVNPERNIADASVPTRSISGSRLSPSGGNTMMKVFGGDDEGDDFEMGGGTENQNFYNDIPVGEGVFAFMVFGFIYMLFKLRKRDVSVS